MSKTLVIGVSAAVVGLFALGGFLLWQQAGLGSSSPSPAQQIPPAAPAPSPQPQSEVPDNLNPIHEEEATSPGDLVIVSPSEGAKVFSGETVPVIINSNPSLRIERVLVVGPGVAQTDELEPFRFDLAIPIEAIGEFQISAVGSDGNNNFFGSNKITLFVTPRALLESINLIPKDPILFGIGEKQNLNAQGSFTDGVMRDITSSTTGTEYLTSSPEVVTVSSEGVITSVSEGVATIAARKGSVQDSISVRVMVE